jgi:hypothetical protein
MDELVRSAGGGMNSTALKQNKRLPTLGLVAAGTVAEERFFEIPKYSV